VALAGTENGFAGMETLLGRNGKTFRRIGKADGSDSAAAGDLVQMKKFNQTQTDNLQLETLP
jgi:hypothetical protein